MSRTVKCEFCGNQRSIKATTAGLLEQQYDELLNFETSDRYDERQKAALAYAEAIVWRLDLDDKFWDRLHGHFSEPELVELGCFVGVDVRPAELDPAARHRPPRVHGRHRRLDGAGLRDAPRTLAETKAEAGLLGQGVSCCWPRRGRSQYRLASTMDGLYTPYALQRPAGDGPHPFVFLAYGNGGGGLAWLRERVAGYPYVVRRLLDAGYACAWGRYRSEVELGYHTGGPLVRDRRQGMDLFNRSPLEFEDEVAILDDVRSLPGDRPGADRPRRRQPRGRDALQDRLGVPGRGHGRGRL